jgi:hypothetical protein
MAKTNKKSEKKFQVSETWLDPESGAVLPENHEVVGQEFEPEKEEDSAPIEE